MNVWTNGALVFFFKWKIAVFDAWQCKWVIQIKETCLLL